MKKYEEEFLNYIYSVRNYSIKTRESYQKDLDLFIEFTNNKIDITYKDIRKYLEYLYDKKYAIKSIARHISSLKSFFNYLQSENIIDDNPTILVSSPKLEKKIPNFLYYDELEILFNKNKDILSDDDKETIKFVIEKAKRKIDEQLGDDK